jgi:transporter family protein
LNNECRTPDDQRRPHVESSILESVCHSIFGVLSKWLETLPDDRAQRERKFLMPLWFLWSSLALVSWGIWALLSKVIGDALSAVQSQALSTIGLLPVLAALAFARKEARSASGGDLPPHPFPLTLGGGEGVRRTGEGEGTGKPADVSSASERLGIWVALSAGILSCLGNIAYYHALNLGGKAATVIPLTALYPLVTIVLALALLGESLNRTQLIGIILSLAAIYLFNVQSDGGFLSTWLAFASIPIGLWGVAGLLQKISTHHLSGETSTFWFLSAFVPVAMLLLIFQPWPERITPRTWLLVAALGLFFGLGNYALLAAFARQGKASVITPLTALYPVVSVPIAVFFLGEKVGAREWVGISFALASVVALSYEKPNEEG